MLELRKEFEIRKAEIKDFADDFCPLFDHLVQEGWEIFLESMNRADQSNYLFSIPLLCFSQLEMMDACSTLIKNSHLIPLELQVRSIFESYFYIRYIECEKGKAEERSLAYLSEFDEQPTRLGDKMKMNDEKWERLKKEKDRFLKE